MAFLNEFQIFGSVINDVALTQSNGDDSFIRVYVNCVYKELDASSNFKEHSSVIPVSIYGTQAATFSTLRKGSLIGVQGHIKSAFDIVTGRHSVEFVADDGRMVLIEAPNNQSPNNDGTSQNKSDSVSQSSSEFSPVAA